VVKRFRELKFGSKNYDGIEISIDADMRDFEQNLCELKAKKKKPGVEFLLSVPAMKACHWNDKHAHDKKLNKSYAGNTANPLITANSAVTTAWTNLDVKDEGRKKVLELVLLPCNPNSGVGEYSDKPFLKADENTDSLVIHQEMILATFDTGRTDKEGHPLRSFSSHLSWFLVDMKSGYEVSPDRKKNTGADVLDEAFDGMFD
jgi:hypothetical protein